LLQVQVTTERLPQLVFESTALKVINDVWKPLMWEVQEAAQVVCDNRALLWRGSSDFIG